jgi:hypothetical protein
MLKAELLKAELLKASPLVHCGVICVGVHSNIDGGGGACKAAES